MEGIFAWCSVIRIHTTLFTPSNRSGRGYMTYNFMFVAPRDNCGMGLIYHTQTPTNLIRLLIMMVNAACMMHIFDQLSTD